MSEPEPMVALPLVLVSVLDIVPPVDDKPADVPEPVVPLAPMELVSLEAEPEPEVPLDALPDDGAVLEVEAPAAPEPDVPDAELWA